MSTTNFLIVCLVGTLLVSLGILMVELNTPPVNPTYVFKPKLGSPEYENGYHSQNYDGKIMIHSPELLDCECVPVNEDCFCHE